jgi:hypothetical protein
VKGIATVPVTERGGAASTAACGGRFPTLSIVTLLVTAMPSPSRRPSFGAMRTVTATPAVRLRFSALFHTNVCSKGCVGSSAAAVARPVVPESLDIAENVTPSSE